MEMVYHNSWLPQYRAPFGAVKTGGSVYVRLDTSLPARLRLWQDGGERILPGRQGLGFTEFTVQAEAPGLIWYYFIVDAPEGVRYYGGCGGPGVLYDYPPPSYQITVYDDFAVPDWFTGGVAYQIFPDRFCRIGRGGLPRLQYHAGLGRPTYTHEDWRDPVLYGPLPGAADYDPCDFYGGDIAGIESKLDYLASLGVSCIYLNPIFESPSNHRYNISDYMKVDPVLGTDAELSHLAAAAKERGIRLMLDGVFSHTGDDSVYFDKRYIYGHGAYSDSASPYKDWYEFTNYPDAYRCWWGFKTLPELCEMNPSYMEFVAEVLAHYAALGITSWRLDVADELPDAFIAFLRERLKRLDPEGVLLGEVWEDASNKISLGEQRRYAMGRELDSAMGYPFREAVCDFLLYRTDAFGLYYRLMLLREHYPEPFYGAQLNLLGSHDTVRILTVLAGAPGRDALTRTEQAEWRPDDSQAARAVARLKLAAILQYVCPGVPCIYYGDEAGMTGMADPFCRGTYPWGRENNGIKQMYAQLGGIRRDAALTRGACGFAVLNENVLAVLRRYDHSVLALVNRGERAETVTVTPELFCAGPDTELLAFDPCWQDMDGRTYDGHDGVLNVVLPPISGILLIGKKE